MPPVLLALATLLLAGLLRLVWRARRSPLRPVPGPLLSSLSNLPLLLHVVRGTYIAHARSLHARYGPVVRIGVDQVSVADVGALRHILSSHSFRKGRAYEANIFLVPTTFSTTSPDVNRARRRQTGQCYTLPHLRRLEPRILEHGAQALVRLWDARMARAEPVNYFYAFHALAFDVIGELGFGRSFGLLASGSTRPTDNVHRMMQLAVLQGTLPLLRRFTWPVRRHIAGRAELIAIAEDAIRRRRQDNAAGRKSADADADILQHLLDARDPATGAPLDADSLVSELVMLLVAGTDTTSSTLTWATMHLLHHPDVALRLRRALCRRFPDRAAWITYDEARAEPLLTAVLLESMRLLPAASGYLPRRVPQPQGASVLGFHVPADAEINVALAACHRDAATWPDPHAFRPERFLGEDAEARARDVLAFSLGVRACVGRSLAWIELYTVMANVLRRYALVLPEDAPYGPHRSGPDGLPEDVPCATFLTCAPSNPQRDCWVRLLPAEDALGCDD
ncbi:hypothetical protein GGI15_001722 [Coemansia interrupta]|uniref:Cytochrome P450 n=1 Tax=Coemansia interrupta TaxID=1126814 RepID=A0A9W8HNI9_9FUNG|nr:hypothetical protein GGI15_001722 [Coemansia interrupta]